MSWIVILQIVWAIIKLIFSGKFDAKTRDALLVRMRTAEKKAKESGDTRDLENLFADLRGDHRGQ
jgi:hypothetical protein